MNVHHLLTTYGYAAVFVFVGIESLGIPLPGETMLITAGAYAGSTHKLSVWGIVAASIAGAIIGDNIGFWIGDKGGYRLLHRYGRYIRFDEPKMKIGRYIFDRHGPKVVFFGRFVSVLRTYAAFLAGTNRMSWRKFLIFNAAGGVIWSAIYGFVAYGAGHTLHRLSGTINLVLGIVAVIAIATAFVVMRRHIKKLEATAEAAYPGPLPAE
ncbi:MAG: DedA family protein [Acidimicrobiales bacterium]|nr:DedA family protein [Acidimicrobiales bacterium]